MSLTELAIKNRKPSDKPVKMPDERGLFLLVHPNGSKYWRLRYSFEGRERLLALGVYPDISLAEARERRDQARRHVANGVDPGVLKQVSKRATRISSENSFEAITREWYVKHSKNWVPSHGDRIIKRLERDIFPWIGSSPIANITVPELLSVLRRIEDRGALETAHRALQNCGQIFRYAVATGRVDRDPTGDLRGALPPPQVKSFAAIIDPQKLGQLMRSIEVYEGSFITKCALRLAPLVFVRPGELRKAEWSEINLELAEWNIPAEKMKMRQPHLVPLSEQAVKILKELFPLTGEGKYLFPCVRTTTRPMSDNTINSALKRLGYDSSEMTTHGFRATARTILDEALGFRPDIIEHQLAHAVKDPNGRAYNRTSHLQARKEMMQKWADYLEQVSEGAKAIPLQMVGNQHA
jgi:integrase